LTLALAPDATAGAYTLLVYGGSGSVVPGTYTIRIAATPGSPAIAPLTLGLTIVSPPG